MASIRLAPLLRARAVPTPAPRTFTRAASTDLVITHRNDNRKSGQPIIKKGPPTGGRSASSGHTVTVFGCTGFLGRYLVHRLGRQGCQVVIPYRDEDEKRHLKIMGDLGQIVPLEWDARNPDQIYECVKHSDTVYNLVGREWETRNFSYHDVNVKTAKLIAEVATHANVPRMIHVSHLNAAPDSPSAYYRTKYQGERAVRDAFPEATIVRPGPLFGFEDSVLNAAARFPALFKLNGGRTRILPVHVTDVVSALATMLNAPITSTSSTFVLPGPETFTYTELLQLVNFFTMRPVSKFPTIPKPIATLLATVVNRAFWFPTISPDEIERRYIDDVGVEAARIRKAAAEVPSGWAAQSTVKVLGIDGEPVKGWAELDIKPDPIEDHAIKYLRSYRQPHNYDAPIEMGHFKPRKAYHVVP